MRIHRVSATPLILLTPFTSLAIAAAARARSICFLIFFGLYQLVLAHRGVGTKHVLQVVQGRVVDTQSCLRHPLAAS